ncbi:hypothetical protein M3936_16510 [Sutcliffiella horikoshii]|uniref:hypothetical protein n=1 Tax=Sutcliffiella horikoshii TaxID=79883 RepID=UPI00203E51E5|nr:hypothetical protein [Sutcliffiella horikoshii]MCM3619193.1 hypothetical protein [Sutcliffiella horikoshii]
MGQALKQLTMSMAYIAAEELNFLWNLAEVREFDQFWQYGIKHGRSPEQLIIEAAEYFDRDEDEIIILVICRKRKGKI